MADKQITHIRESVWRGETVNEVRTLCGTNENSISYEHAMDYWNEKTGPKQHVASLELCDDCYEEFKQQYAPHEYHLDALD